MSTVPNKNNKLALCSREFTCFTCHTFSFIISAQLFEYVPNTSTIRVCVGLAISLDGSNRFLREVVVVSTLHEIGTSWIDRINS